MLWCCTSASTLRSALTWSTCQGDEACSALARLPARLAGLHAEPRLATAHLASPHHLRLLQLLHRHQLAGGLVAADAHLAKGALADQLRQGGPAGRRRRPSAPPAGAQNASPAPLCIPREAAPPPTLSSSKSSMHSRWRCSRVKSRSLRASSSRARSRCSSVRWSPARSSSSLARLRRGRSPAAWRQLARRRQLSRRRPPLLPRPRPARRTPVAPFLEVLALHLVQVLNVDAGGARLGEHFVGKILVLLLLQAGAVGGRHCGRRLGLAARLGLHPGLPTRRVVIQGREAPPPCAQPAQTAGERGQACAADEEQAAWAPPGATAALSVAHDTRAAPARPNLGGPAPLLTAQKRSAPCAPRAQAPEPASRCPGTPGPRFPGGRSHPPWPRPCPAPGRSAAGWRARWRWSPPAQQVEAGATRVPGRPRPCRRAAPTWRPHRTACAQA